MMSCKYHINTGGLKALAANIEKNNVKIQVGYFAENSPEHHDGLSVYQVASMQEYGTTKAPARPFMAQAVESYKMSPSGGSVGVVGVLKRFWNRLVHGDQVQEELAEEMQKDFTLHLQNTIIDGTFAPLNPRTIARKGHDLPLVDTEKMINGIQWRRVR